MAKKKKSKKKKSLYKAIKPFIKDKRVVYSLLGAVGVGALLASFLGREKVSAFVEDLSGKVKELEADESSGKRPKTIKQANGVKE
jgi:hypothetical protein